MPVPLEILMAIQSSLLNAGYSIGSPTPDGKFGPATLSALKTEGVISNLSEGIASIELPPSNSRPGLTQKEVNDLIDEAVLWFYTVKDRRASHFRSAVANSGSSLGSYLSFLVDNESLKKGGLISPDQVSPSGLHFGLTQIGRGAYSDATGLSRDLPYVRASESAPLKAILFDPLMNLKAALAFAAANWQYLQAKKSKNLISQPSYSHELMYLMHNQGNMVIDHMVKRPLPEYKLFGGQSQKARSLFRQSEGQIRASLGLAKTSSGSGKSLVIGKASDIDYSATLGSSSFTIADFTVRPAANSSSKSYLIQDSNGACRATAKEVVDNLTDLAEFIEPFMKKHEGKMRINSGYRQGKTASAHEIGAAVDITTVLPSSSKAGQEHYKAFVADVAVHLKEVDQLISETGRVMNDVWLHIGMKRQNGEVRGRKSSGRQGASFETDPKYASTLVEWYSGDVIA